MCTSPSLTHSPFPLSLPHLPSPLPHSLTHSLLLSASSDHRSFFSLFIGATKKNNIFVVDRVRTNQMPNMTTLYQTERKSRQEQYENYPVPSEDITFDVRIDTELRRVRS